MNAALLAEIQLVDYILHNPIVNDVILLHNPNSNTIGTRGKGRPNKARKNNLVVLVKIANEEIRVEEVDHDYVFSTEDYAKAHCGALYLPDYYVMLLYCAWCTDEELWMATMFGFLFTCDTTPMMNIEDRPLMRVAAMTKQFFLVGRFSPTNAAGFLNFNGM
jgi:hypothetical protein